jgi:hypothetical protein
MSIAFGTRRQPRPCEREHFYPAMNGRSAVVAHIAAEESPLAALSSSLRLWSRRAVLLLHSVF